MDSRQADIETAARIVCRHLADWEDADTGDYTAALGLLLALSDSGVFFQSGPYGRQVSDSLLARMREVR